jgi:ribosomal protein S21
LGAKVIVREGESIESALRRLKEWIFKGNRYPVYRPKPTKRRIEYRQKPCEVGHQRRSLAKSRQQHNLNWLLKKNT